MRQAPVLPHSWPHSGFHVHDAVWAAAEARLGNREAAQRISVDLASLDRPYLFGNHTRWRARIAVVLGEREEAVHLLREAFRDGLAYGSWLHKDMDFESVPDYPPVQELLRPKG